MGHRLPHQPPRRCTPINKCAPGWLFRLAAAHYLCTTAVARYLRRTCSSERSPSKGPVPRWNRLVAQGPGIFAFVLHARSNSRVRRKRQDDTRAGPPAFMASASTIPPFRPSFFELYSTSRSGLRCSLASLPPAPPPFSLPPSALPGVGTGPLLVFVLGSSNLSQDASETRPGKRAVRHRSDLPISPALSVISTASRRQPIHTSSPPAYPSIHHCPGPLVPLLPLVPCPLLTISTPGRPMIHQPVFPLSKYDLTRQRSSSFRYQICYK